MGPKSSDKCSHKRQKGQKIKRLFEGRGRAWLTQSKAKDPSGAQELEEARKDSRLELCRAQARPTSRFHILVSRTLKSKLLLLKPPGSWLFVTAAAGSKHRLFFQFSTNVVKCKKD